MKTPSRFLASLRRLASVYLACALACSWLAPRAAAQSVTILPAPELGGSPPKNFESPQVHPLALTPDGSRLLAVNSPNATLSVFQLGGPQPLLTAEIPVGLEPVSVAARNDREAWVVNWLSDSVSVVDLTTGNVTRTIDVGDEPTDVLFTGPDNGRAFVCVSGPAQVKVFDAAAGSQTPLGTLNLFGKQPRALARDASGSQVFVSMFESGNQTTLVPQPIVQQQGGLPAPVPALAPGLPPAPTTALIVKWNGAQWADETGNTKWDPFINFTLADVDLVAIDAAAPSPSVSAQVRGLGTHMGNMAFDPTAGRLYVANLESESVRRFEPNLRGNFQHSRVSVLNVAPGGNVSLASTNDLNSHVNFSNPAGTDAERALSLALPADVARHSDGTLFVAATSSAKVGVLSAAGVVEGRVDVGAGPTGLALDEARQRLYVLNRFDQTLSVVDSAARAQLSQVAVGFNPEPPDVRNGRRFLYDARTFSAHGTVSCASCHPSGHRDGLGWDLGDPTGAVVTVFGAQHHPMKGPMTTQSLRAIIGAEPLHWRADRNNLSEFNPAFTGLLGSTRLLTAQEMSAFTAFVRTLTYPPNPHEGLDRSYADPATGTSPADGARAFQAGPTLAGLSCNTCHRAFGLPSFGPGTDRLLHPGGILAEPQTFKSPQLRGLYQKTGMQKPAAGQPRAEQVTGFGFMHDGQFDTIFNFLRQPFFQGFQNDQVRRNVEAFILAFDTGLAPAVGLQVTVNAGNKTDPAVLSRLQLLMQQTRVTLNAGNCDLVVRGLYGGGPRGFLFDPALQSFRPDSRSEANVTLQTLLDAVEPGAELTFTGVPVGTGTRFGIDRDSDGTLDDDEPRSGVSITGRVVDASGNPLPGVAVTLSGTQRAVATTDSAGRYAFNYVSVAGTHTVAPAAPGLSFTPSERTFANPTWNQSAAFISSAAANASDATSFFVRQHYNDFLAREPDADGLAFWTNEVEKCNADQQCRQVRRVNVSAAFFLAIEFQETGYLAYRTYKSAFGERGRPVPVTYEDLMTDRQRIGRHVVVGVGDWQARLEANKNAYMLGFVSRPDFQAAFPAGVSPTQFVDQLNQNAGGVVDGTERQQLINDLTADNTLAGRAGVLRRVAENQTLRDRELRKAFVLMEYFGYLRRDPDDVGFDGQPDPEFKGFNFWLGKLNEHNGNFVHAEMVRSFIESIEYRRRFGQ